MASKALIVFGLLLAAALLVSSEIAAAEQHEETKANGEGLQDEKYDGGGYPGGGRGYHGGGGYPGGGGGSHGGGGYPGGGGGSHGGGGYPGGGGGSHGGGGHGGRCYHGCCRRGYNGCICCSTATEKPTAEYLPEPQH